jgi:hypothetical protein
VNLRKIAASVIVLSWTSFAFAQEAAAPPAVTASKAVKLSGFIQILGKKQEAGPDSVSVRRARFGLTVDLAKSLKGKFVIDAVRSPVLVEAQVDAVFSEAATLRFGQFYIPFGFESTTSASDLEMINYAQPVEKLAPGRDLGTFGRDVGATLTGTYSIFDYSVGFFNGAGANKADTNDKKDFAGRLRVKPFDFLSFGASLYRGLYSAAAGTPATTRDRTGLDAAVSFGRATLKGEVIWAVDEATDKFGWFVRGAVFVLPKKLQIAAMYDTFDKDRNSANDRVDIYTAGLNWFFADKTKVQVNVEYSRNERAQTINKALLVQFQAAF